jgi:nucleotide-binding universal stress UspA family protein
MIRIQNIMIPVDFSEASRRAANYALSLALEFEARLVLAHIVPFEKPDYGIWEVRNGPFHFVYSKAMIWMALDRASRLLADSAIEGFTVNEERLTAALERNPILVTALNPVIGYEQGAAIAKRAYAEGRPIREVAAEQTDLSDEQLASLLDPLDLTRGGIKGKG